jgi:hypothetical protein
MHLATANATVNAVTGPWLWALNTGAGTSRLARYQIHTNCDLRSETLRGDAALSGKAGLWLSADVKDVFTAWTSVYDAVDLTLAERVTTDLPFVPSHLRTTMVSTTLVGAVAQHSSSQLSTFSRAAVGDEFLASDPKPFPLLGHNGNPIANYGRFGFVKRGEAVYSAIVRANVGTDAAPVYRWGLVNLGP